MPHPCFGGIFIFVYKCTNNVWLARMCSKYKSKKPTVQTRRQNLKIDVTSVKLTHPTPVVWTTCLNVVSLDLKPHSTNHEDDSLRQTCKKQKKAPYQSLNPYKTGHTWKISLLAILVFSIFMLCLNKLLTHYSTETWSLLEKVIHHLFSQIIVWYLICLCRSLKKLRLDMHLISHLIDLTD